MELYKSKYQTIRLVDKGLILEKIWETCETMSADEFQYEQLCFRRFLEQHKPKLVFINATLMEFVIDVNLQTWNAKQVLSYFASIGGRKIAVLSSTELISSLAIEQTFDEAEDLSFVTHYFDNELQAKAWLIKEISFSC